MNLPAVDMFSGKEKPTGAFAAERAVASAGEGATALVAERGAALAAVVSAEQAAAFDPGLAARFNAELMAESDALEAAGVLVPPGDLWDPDDPACSDGPVWLREEDLFDELPPMSRVDALERELWAGVEQDEVERLMLRQKAPAWVFLRPGAELAAALEAVRPQWESPMALIELMKAAARMSAWAESIKAAAMASFYRQRKAQATELPRPSETDSSGRPVDPERSWTAEIGAALHLSKETAARHIDTALHLTGPLAATHTALRCGALSWSKALAISEATRPLSAAAAQAVEAHVLRRAAGQTHKNLGESLRRQVAKYAAKEEADRHRDAVRDRTCKIVPLADGMAGLWVVHTADKIQQMWVVVQAMADLAKRGTAADSSPPATTADSTTRATPTDEILTAKTGTGTGTGHPTSGVDSNTSRTSEAAGSGPGERVQDEWATNARATNARATNARATNERATNEQATNERAKDERTAGQRRADVVADVFEHILRSGADWLGRRLPDQHRRRPHIEVLIPITTLVGIDENPCDLTGYGPIPAEMARRIAGDGTWRRLLTDPTNGMVLEASTTRHDPGAIVSETLLARHPVCAWPGCNRTSRECDRDHATPFARTGRTRLAGLVPYCEYHHVIKDNRAWGWTTTDHPDGSVTT
ncbi:DUF222 domain-containing protein [Kribbella sp. NPDC050124]|uniref:HNH endonuclease signature motif containing protein n=1 Tax=Kribbella sp. NPDC050124 TaxID=3364114 RepID=UPI0037A45EBB